MTRQPFVCPLLLVLLLPAIFTLSCNQVRRDWNVCAPNAPCKGGYTCTEFRCVRTPDGGLDSSLAVDGPGTSDTAMVGPDRGPDIGPDIGQPGGIGGAGGVATDAPTGGVTSAGGAGGTGGVLTTGGAVSGGNLATGGAAGGGAPTTGGIPNTGGVVIGNTLATGGMATGGATGTGGMASTGGVATGGASASSGTTTICVATSCAAGTYCNGATCVSKKTAGACLTDVECSTGFCTDGACCNSRCDGKCESCSTGTCNFASAPRSACGGTGKCAGYCDKTDTKKCTFPGNTTACLDANCSAKVFQGAGSCDGTGKCSAPSPKPCTYVCSATAGCAGSCNPGDKACNVSTGVPQLCDADGKYQDQTACSTGRTCTGAGSCTCVGCTFPATCGGCGGWNFEAGPDSAENWAIGGEPGALISAGNGAANIQISSSKPNPANPSSRYSLAVPIFIDGTTVFGASVAVPLCQAGKTVNLAGYRLTGAVYLMGQPDFNLYSAMHVDSYGPSGVYDWGIQLFGTLRNNMWNQLDYTFTENLQVDHIAIRVDPNQPFSGTMYIDDLVITGP